MPRLPALKPREVIKKLEKLGFIKHHQEGSHLVMKNSKENARAVVPMHLRDIPKGTLSAILREAEVDRDRFIKA